VDDPALLRRQSDEARDFIHEWTAPAMAEKMLALYRRIVTDGRMVEALS
jgi:hypothetical protein